MHNNTPHDPTPAPAHKPMPTFGGTLADRMERTPMAGRVLQTVREENRRAQLAKKFISSIMFHLNQKHQ